MVFMFFSLMVWLRSGGGAVEGGGFLILNIGPGRMR